MMLSQFEFVLFLAAVVIILWVQKNNFYRKLILLTANICFYCYWDYRFCLLLSIPVFVDFYCGRMIHRSVKNSYRFGYLLGSLFVNVGILVAFKYFDFFLDSFKPLLQSFGLNARSLDLILPLGISFYTFRTLSYTIDSYYRKNEPCNSLLDYAVFITFFPIIVAGPISRASYFLPQLSSFSPSSANLNAGIRLFVIGFFKKLYIADNLGAYVDPFFGSPLLFDSATAWCVTIAYTLQIYFDFAGYSDIAIGASRMMGFHIEDNFRFPYLATSVSEYWKRWHITLSNWIRDYVYIPLGGNRRGQIRTYVNVMVAMLLCGLWHGAGWTFVFWGGCHGIALCLNRVAVYRAKSHKRIRAHSLPTSVLRWFLTFLFLSLVRVPFRSPDFETAWQILGQLFYPHPGVTWISPFAMFIIMATAIIHILKANNLTKIIELPEKAWYTPAVLFCLAWLVFLFHAREFTPFIYAQF
jgi:alginate O-acetyltransferase complex protein AlgI